MTERTYCVPGITCDHCKAAIAQTGEHGTRGPNGDGSPVGVRMRYARRLLPAVLLVGAAMAGGCSHESGGNVVPPSTSAPSVGEGAVVVKGIAFNPKQVHTPVGKEVVWTFDDGGLEHTVTADDGSFDSGRKGSGQFKQVFSRAGTTAYHCSVHARMHGTIVVT